MQNDPFHISQAALRTFDYCFHRLCWNASPADVRRSCRYLPGEIDLDAILRYLNAETVAAEYISPFFPTERRKDFCQFKIAQGWSDDRLKAFFPLSTLDIDLQKLRAEHQNLDAITRCLLAASSPRAKQPAA